MVPLPTIYSTDVLTPEALPLHRLNSSLNEFTMQSRLMTEEEAKIGKRSEWFRINLTGPVKNFPRTLCSLTYITTLVIKNNHLERLPPELGNLVNLVNLDASHNKLRLLPPTLGDLTDLRALILNDNKITDLPLEIGRLLNLRHFNLHDNPLNSEIGSIYSDGSEPSIRRMIRHYMDCYYRCNSSSLLVHRSSSCGFSQNCQCKFMAMGTPDSLSSVRSSVYEKGFDKASFLTESGRTYSQTARQCLDNDSEESSPDSALTTTNDSVDSCDGISIDSTDKDVEFQNPTTTTRRRFKRPKKTTKQTSIDSCLSMSSISSTEYGSPESEETPVVRAVVRHTLNNQLRYQIHQSQDSTPTAMLTEISMAGRVPQTIHALSPYFEVPVPLYMPSQLQLPTWSSDTMRFIVSETVKQVNHYHDPGVLVDLTGHSCVSVSVERLPIVNPVQILSAPFDSGFYNPYFPFPMAQRPKVQAPLDSSLCFTTTQLIGQSVATSESEEHGSLSSFPLTIAGCYATAYPLYPPRYPRLSTGSRTKDNSSSESWWRLAPQTRSRVYIPPPLLLPRAKDHCRSLKKCAVPLTAFTNYINSSPPQRQWRRLESPSKDGIAITLMCYNVLSANYATTTQYPYCPSWAIDWEYRRRGILEELRKYSASIICLQEIDTDHFDEVFKPELCKLGYEGIFLAKSRCRTMDPSAQRKVDGCAIFWQAERFTKVTEFHHEFMLSCSSVSEHPSALLLNRVMTRDNVAVGVVFESKGGSTSGRRFCVSTGHIHWDPEHSDVKLIQTIMWTAELWSRLDQLEASLDGSGAAAAVSKATAGASRMPVVFCGDFNSLPTSGVVEFLSKGCVPKSHVEFLNYGFNYQFEDWKMLEKWAVDGDILRHRFNFDRAYKAEEGMTITNLTYDFKGMIDYIFFTRHHFKLLRSLDQISDDWFREERILGCPHINVPSDHFPLLVELDLLAAPQRQPGLVVAEPTQRHNSTSPKTVSSSSATTTTSTATASTNKTNGNRQKNKR